MKVHQTFLTTLAIALFAATMPCFAAGEGSSQDSNHAININFSDVRWQKIVPELGDRSSEIAILHVDRITHATKLMIRVPPNVHVPQHWHSANETHTVVDGTFVVECDGKRAELGKGSFTYIPAKRPHEAWTRANEGALLFITVDSAWDINWVNGPPKPSDFSPGLPGPSAAGGLR